MDLFIHVPKGCEYSNVQLDPSTVSKDALGNCKEKEMATFYLFKTIKKKWESLKNWYALHGPIGNWINIP